MTTMTVLSAPAMAADFEIDGINGTDVSGANFVFGSPDFLAVGNFSGDLDDGFLPFGIDDGFGQGLILVGDVTGDVDLSGPQTFLS
jgi:hypothetical protein